MLEDNMTAAPSESVTPEEKKEVTERDIKALALRVIKADIDVSERASNAEQAKRSEQYDLFRAREATRDTYTQNKKKTRRRSSINSSDVMNCVEWLMPDFMRAFAGNKRAIAVIPRGEEDVKKAEKIEKLLNWQFMNECQGFLTLQEWIKAGLVYGIGHLKVSWDERYKYEGFNIPEVIEPEFQKMVADDSIDSLSYEGQYEKVVPAVPGSLTVPNVPAPTTMRVFTDVVGERKTKVYSGPKLEVIPPEDFLIDPNALDIDSARFVIHRVERTISYLRKKEREGIYSNIDEVVAKSSGGRGDINTGDTEEKERQAVAENYSALYGDDDVSDNDQVGRRKVNVYEWWGELDIHGDGKTESYLAVVCENVMIRFVRNPYAHGKSPFVDLCPILDIFEYAGIGFAEIAGPYQKIKTSIINQIIDNVSFQNNGMWEVDENAGVDVDALANPFPGKIVFTNRLGGIKPITPASLDATGYNLIEFAQNQLEQVTGVTRYNQGLDAKSLNKTATGISAIMNASNQRKELIARTIAETGLRKLFEKMLQLDQQFVDQQIVVRLFNEPLEISPDDLAGNFDVTVDTGNSVTDDNTQVQQLAQMLQLAPQFIQMGIMSPINVYEISKKILGLWGYKQVDMFLTDPAQSEQAKQVMSAIMQIINQLQSGRMPDPVQLAQVLTGTLMTMGSLTGVNPQMLMGGVQGGQTTSPNGLPV